ncbi:hypothetical protein DAI22_09g088300 [Oryza sativa Japonica Group]|nr:hypothetical protein DAI22_09g088300 [Oryza sativa Japonica Group]
MVGKFLYRSHPKRPPPVSLTPVASQRRTTRGERACQPEPDRLGRRHASSVMSQKNLNRANQPNRNHARHGKNQNQRRRRRRPRTRATRGFPPLSRPAARALHVLASLAPRSQHPIRSRNKSQSDPPLPDRSNPDSGEEL